jgi:hypothetical protein
MKYESKSDMFIRTVLIICFAFVNTVWVPKLYPFWGHKESILPFLLTMPVDFLFAFLFFHYSRIYVFDKKIVIYSVPFSIRMLRRRKEIDYGSIIKLKWIRGSNNGPTFKIFHGRGEKVVVTSLNRLNVYALEDFAKKIEAESHRKIERTWFW